MLILLTWLGLASAASTSPLVEGYYQLATGRAEAAAQVAAALIQREEKDLAAHRLYIQARLQLGEGAALEDRYRAWAKDSEHPTAQASLALALVLNDPTDARCARALTLLPATTNASLELQIAHIHETALRRCHMPTGPALARVRALTTPDAQEWLTLTTLWSPEIPRGYDLELGELLLTHPHRLRIAAAIFEAEGPGARATQRAVLKVARAQLESKDPVSLFGALKVFRAAKAQEERQRASARLRGLDPKALPPTDKLPPLDDLRLARSLPSQAQVIEALLDLESELPADGFRRMYWAGALAQALEKDGRPEEALSYWRQAMEATPEDPVRAYVYAKHAARVGAAQEGALEAVHTALALDDARLWPAQPAGKEPPITWGAWRQERALRRSLWLSVQGRLLDQLGQEQRALEVLSTAVLLADQPAAHLELGLVLTHHGRAVEGVQHLLLGLQLADTEVPIELLDEATDQANASLTQAGVWDAQGATELARALAAVAPAPTERPRGEPASADEHPLLGQPFPDIPLRIHGVASSLSDIEGPLVVDLWATWCGPCVSGMDHLDDVAKTYAEHFTVVAVSVDAKEKKALRFISRGPERTWVGAWSGTGAFRATHTRSIPAQFVLDEEHKVIAVISGNKGARDQRLERAIDQHLAAIERR